jgi:hypothetical protein
MPASVRERGSVRVQAALVCRGCQVGVRAHTTRPMSPPHQLLSPASPPHGPTAAAVATAAPRVPRFICLFPLPAPHPSMARMPRSRLVGELGHLPMSARTGIKIAQFGPDFDIDLYHQPLASLLRDDDDNDDDDDDDDDDHHHHHHDHHGDNDGRSGHDDDHDNTGGGGGDASAALTLNLDAATEANADDARPLVAVQADGSAVAESSSHVFSAAAAAAAPTTAPKLGFQVSETSNTTALVFAAAGYEPPPVLQHVIGGSYRGGRGEMKMIQASARGCCGRVRGPAFEKGRGGTADGVGRAGSGSRWVQ